MGMRREAPDVDIVHLAHAGDLQHLRRHALDAEALGRAFEQNVGRVSQNAYGGPDDHAGNQKSQERIDQVLAGLADEPGARHNAHVRERVAQIVDEYCTQVQVATLAQERERDSTVDDQCYQTHHQHGPTCDGDGSHGAFVALITEEERHAHQDQRIGERGQDADTVITEGLLVVGRFLLKVERELGKNQGGDIGEVVPAIAEEGQAVCQSPGHEFQCHQ